MECGRINVTLASREKLVSDKCIKKLKIRMEELLYTE
nr:MAG TPA: hypothetical protein [Caudoviricetes sp.]